MSRADDLRADFDRLGRLLDEAEGSGAAAIARERRLIGELLDKLEVSRDGSLVDQLAAKRSAKSKAARPAARRRQSR